MSDNDSSGTSFHGQGSAAPDAGPTLAERARTLVDLGGQSSLSTFSRKHPGFPFGSLMPYAADHIGRPMFLISSLAVHTKNLKEEPKCSLFVTRNCDTDSPLGAARITLIGTVQPVESDRNDAMEDYLARHPDAKQWASFGDFGLYQMEIIDVYFVGGFGIMDWILGEDYKNAKPDPLAKFADEIVEHFNRDHHPTILAIASKQPGIVATHATMTSIDQHGFDVKLLTGQGVKGVRVQFPSAVTTPQEVREIITTMSHGVATER